LSVLSVFDNPRLRGAVQRCQPESRMGQFPAETPEGTWHPFRKTKEESPRVPMLR
jgi:hypothetical protein